MLALFRGLDISFSISQLLARNASADDLLNGVIDQDRIAAGGHSLGGGGAYSVAAGDDLFCDARYLSLLVGDPWPIDWLCIGVSPDSRVKAIIPIDAVSENSRFEELARISVPSLIVTQPVENLLAYGYGSEAKGGRPHVAIDRGDSYRIDFGSTHYMFFNVCAYIRVAYGYGVMTAEWAAYNLDYHKCNPGQGLSPARPHHRPGDMAGRARPAEPWAAGLRHQD